LNSKYDGPLSKFAFNCNLRHYTVVAMELRNEPREVCPGKSWHVGPATCDPTTFIDPKSISESAAAVNDTFGSAMAAAEAAREGYDTARCAWPQWDKGPQELRYKAAMVGRCRLTPC